MSAPQEPIRDLLLRADSARTSSNSLRVLQLCPTLAGGGAERQLCYLSRELGNRGHVVHIALQNSGPNVDLLAGAKNVHLHFLGQGKRVLQGERSLQNYNPMVLTRLLRLVRRLRPDVVQTWIPQMDVIGGIAAKATSTPWILREPVSANAYTDGGIRVAVRKWLGRTASVVVANSNAGSEYWRHVAHSRRVVIRNGVPIAELDRSPCLNHPRIPGGVSLILWAGRFDQQKNVERTFEAMADAVSRAPAKVVVCGSGPLRGRLEDMLSSFPDRSRIELWPYQTQLWPLMKRADVFVSASLYEGSPNCVMEAMACLRPLVVSDIPEHRELLSDESAEFVDPRSVASISRGIQNVRANPTLTQHRIQRAYSDILQFSVENMANRYEALYHSLVSRSR